MRGIAFPRSLFARNILLLVVLVAAIWGALFFMDRIRKRSAEREEQ